MKIQLEIVCGERTCAAKPGVFCPFLSTRADGSSPRCELFNVLLWDEDWRITGWLQRCKRCLEAGDAARSTKVDEAH